MGNYTSTEYNQINHYHTPKGFMNDIQTIYKGKDNYYHLNYLLNQQNDGTSWYHVKTKDWQHFEDVGVSIPKFNQKWSAVSSGSIIKNDMGIFKDISRDALVAYFTSYQADGQNQYVVYSLDGGNTYKPYNNGLPVMKGASKTSDNRDPYVWYNTKNKKLTMYLAEKDKIGVYTSSNGISWSYTGAVILNKYTLNGKDLGIVECPNLKSLKASNGVTKDILFFGANGYQYGSTTGTYYLVGSVDTSGVFHADGSQTQPQRVDMGSDWYGANFYQESPSSIKAIAWLGNWDYQQGKISDGSGGVAYHIGSMTNVRDLSLVKDGNKYVLITYIKSNLDMVSTSYSSAPYAADKYHKVLLDKTRWTSQDIILKFTGNPSVSGHIRIFFTQKDGEVFIDYNADNGTYQVSRSTKNILSDKEKKAFSKAYLVNSGISKPKELLIKIISDKNSLEITFPNGQTYTLSKMSTDTDTRIRVETGGRNDLLSVMTNIEP